MLGRCSCNYPILGCGSPGQKYHSGGDGHTAWGRGIARGAGAPPQLGTFAIARKQDTGERFRIRRAGFGIQE